MDREKVTIVSDGTAQGTKVHVGDKLLNGVTKLEIDPLGIGEIVTARITVSLVSLRMQLKDADIVCTDIAAEEKIKKALFSIED